MNWALRYVGLETPRCFPRLLAVLAAAFLAILVATTAIGLMAAGELSRHTPRELYFLYLGGLATLGFVLVPWPRLAACVLSLAFVELSLGLGSLALVSLGLAASAVLPHTYNLDRRFEWHPLLQVTPIPAISITDSGFRVTHSTEGTRGRDYSRAELAAKSVVAVFGGSSTYDISVDDRETWPAQLESLLGADNFAVINHGVPGYSTVQHVVQTAFYQTKFEVPPRCALYYVGWNDLRNAHIAGLDPGYADFSLPTLVDALQVRRVAGKSLSISPVLTIALRLVSSWTDTITPARAIEGEPQAASDPLLEALFVRNVRAISAINRDRGIRTIWAGQLLNLDEFDNDGIDPWLPLVRNRDVWPLLSRFNELLRDAAMALGDAYIHVPIEDFQPGDFRDNGHFVGPGSFKFADHIAPAVSRECR